MLIIKKIKFVNNKNNNTATDVCGNKSNNNRDYKNIDNNYNDNNSNNDNS